MLLNSIHAMDSQGKIVIRFYSNQENIVIEFIDSGPGIAPDILPKVFDPLFTTKQHGTGLGLAHAKTSLKTTVVKFMLKIIRPHLQ